MNCQICYDELIGKKSKKICGECYNKKWSVKCVECGKEYEVTAHYYIKLDRLTHKCKQCKLKGKGNPNYGNKWSEELKIEQSFIIKSKVDETYRMKCSKGMKGKKVSDETKEKRKDSMLKKYGRYSNMTGHTKETIETISTKSRNKFTVEYLEKVRKVNEQRGVWVPLEKKDDYHFYRGLSNWNGQILNENTHGIELLKYGEFYNKNNRKKDSLIRDHMYGRISGFENGVFPEIIKHPANCQIITHSNNIKKSKSNNDCVISLDDLFERIKLWPNYIYQDACLSLIEKYKNGERYKKEDYINKIYK